MTEDNEPIEKLATEFADVARRFCAEIDNRQSASSIESFLMALHPLLAELCFRASILPDLEPERESVPARDELAHDEWSRQHKSLEEMLGKYNLYWEVFDPRSEEDPIVSTLATDLSEIYQDLKPGLEALSAAGGSISVDVIWDWRFLFIAHWGHHAIDALRAIHAYAFDFIDDGWD